MTDPAPTTLSQAQNLDASDPLAHLRQCFLIPSKSDLIAAHPEALPRSSQNDPANASIYLCGNSLGLQPACTRTLIDEELLIWATRGVTGHFNHPQSRPWVSASEHLEADMAKIVGALPSEVAVMGTLTENVHLLLASFYKPAGRRKKIIIEGKAFPSDHYAVESQIRWHGLDQEKELVTVWPEGPGHTLTTEGILRIVDKYKDEAAVLWFSGVQYYTGQLFDIKTITEYAQSRGLLVGWDLAHAVGNVELELHEWGVDFAAWCTYKYLCAGPGSIAGLFVHERHASPERHRLSGWWGHDRETRFNMGSTFRAIPGAAGYQLSNPSILGTTALRASLSVYNQTSMKEIRQKSVKLTGFLEQLLNELLNMEEEDGKQKSFEIITPKKSEERGAQLSLLFREGIMLKVYEKLSGEGVVVDERKPDVIRVAPKATYNSFEDCWRFVEVLKIALSTI